MWKERKGKAEEGEGRGKRNVDDEVGNAKEREGNEIKEIK